MINPAPELFPYQKEGAEFLASKNHALLADEMGLGKTPQAIAACDLIMAKRILVICPSVAKINWQREFARFSPNRIPPKVITSRKDSWGEQESLILSFDMAVELLFDLLPSEENIFDVVIIDEAHFLKSIEAKRTQSILGKPGIIRFGKRVWCLTGTPMPNGYANELWSLLFTFGVVNVSYSRFTELFCNGYVYRGAFSVTGTKPDKIPELKNLVSKISIRRRKIDVLPQLPEITFQTLVVPKGEVDLSSEFSFAQYVTPIDRREELVEKLEDEAQTLASVVDKLGESEETISALEAMARGVATLRRYRGLQKVEATAHLIAQELEANAYEKVVVFAVHRDVIIGLSQRLKKFHPVTLFGGMDDAKKQKHIDKFQKDNKTRVFIANIQAAGPAITLTRAHHIVFIEQDWVPGNNAQAAMRCHRIGQKNAVLVRVISLDDPIDERVATALRRKTQQLIQIFD